MEKTFNRPDEAALRRLLSRHKETAAGLILRLAWQAGLNRPQIQALTWDEVDFASAELRLEDRTVPLCEDLLATLQWHRARPDSSASPFVLLTDSHRNHPHTVVISRLASAALDEEEALQGVSLKDLRDDFVIRALTDRGKAYALRVTGIAISTLYSTYGQYVSHSRGNVIEGYPSIGQDADEEKLRKLLSAEGTSPAALALWLIWKQGMTLADSAALTWDEVDLDGGTIRRQGSSQPLHEEVLSVLRRAHSERKAGADPHVLLTPKSRRAFAEDRLDVVVRTALYRADLSHLHLTSLSFASAKETNRETLLRHMARRPFVMRKEVSALLRLTPQQTADFLHRLMDQGDIVRVGARYYLKGTVVPPEEHYALIAARLREEGGSYRKDLADLLRVEERACSRILFNLVRQGKLQRKGQLYTLPEEEK